MTITPTLDDAADLEADGEFPDDARWLAMPNRDDDAAVDAWFAALELHHREADARLEADITACEQLVQSVAELLGIDLAARAKAKAKSRAPVC